MNNIAPMHWQVLQNSSVIAQFNLHDDAEWFFRDIQARYPYPGLRFDLEGIPEDEQ